MATRPVSFKKTKIDQTLLEYVDSKEERSAWIKEACLEKMQKELSQPNNITNEEGKEDKNDNKEIENIQTKTGIEDSEINTENTTPNEASSTVPSKKPKVDLSI